jgi:signal transduction histidine kinase
LSVGTASQYVLVDYDISATAGRRRAENAALIGSGVLTALVLGLVALLYSRLQRALRAQQDQERLAQLGEAARTLAHEIRNPLTAAQMQTALLRRTTGGSDHERLDVLDEELSRIRSLTDQVREFLKSGAGKPELLEPGTIIRALAQRLPFEVVVDTAGEPASIMMDGDRFRSVMTNVIQNAADAMEASSAESTEPAKAVEVHVRPRREHVDIVVADRGPGIPPGDRARLFDPFFTTKDRGSGVGLAISRRFVQEAGGTIDVKNRHGGGAEVTIRLRRVMKRSEP